MPPSASRPVSISARDAGKGTSLDGKLGIDSVMQPYENRKRAWARIATDLPLDKLEAMVTPATLADLPKLGADILAGQVKGRVVVDVNA